MIDNIVAKRRNSLQIKVGDVPVGGNSPISVQSMTNTSTEDISATLKQIQELQAAEALSGTETLTISAPAACNA